MVIDLVSLGITCRRLNQVVGKFLRDNYPICDYICEKDAIYIHYAPNNDPDVNKKFFHRHIPRLIISETQEAVQYLLDFAPKLPEIRFLKYSGVRIPPIIPDSLKAVYGRLIHLFIDGCDLDGSFHHSVLNFCENLTHSFDEQIHIGNINDWLGRKYPSIEYLRIEPCYQMAVELKKFLELNQNVQTLVTNDNIRFDFWMNANVELNELRLDWIESFDHQLCHQLNKLYERKFYERLSLNLDEWNQPPDTIKGLVNLNFSSYEFAADSSIELPMMEELKELWIHSVDAFKDYPTLPNKLKNLEQIRVLVASFEEILSFIRYALKIQSIYIGTLLSDLYFNSKTNIIDLVTLSMERVNEAKKVTIYVEDRIYFATKRKFKKTEFDLVALHRKELDQ